MSGRLADLGDRIDGIQQLGAVVNAMRGIAAARAQQARTHLVAVDRYAATIAAAVGQALALLPEPRRRATPRGSKPALVLFCAEQGFAGAFSERVLDAVGDDLATSDLFLIGTRGAAALAGRGLTAGWTAPVPSHSPGLPKLADRILDAVYGRVAEGKFDRLDAVFSRSRPGHGIDVVRRSLIPFDPAAVPRLRHGPQPLLNLEPAVLLSELTADILHAQLCQAAFHAFEAENEARMDAMAAARTQIERQLSQLKAVLRQVRQEEITAEIIELAAGESASRPAPRRRPRPPAGALDIQA